MCYRPDGFRFQEINNFLSFFGLEFISTLTDAHANDLRDSGVNIFPCAIGLRNTTDLKFSIEDEPEISNRTVFVLSPNEISSHSLDSISTTSKLLYLLSLLKDYHLESIIADVSKI